MAKDYFVHPSANVADEATIGAKTQVWQHCQVREEAVIGEHCILGKGVYIDARVRIGSRVKIQNYVSVYEGVIIEDGVFCGPHCVFTNDRQPRAINPDGSLKGAQDWTVTPTRVQMGASIGANVTIVCGVTIGRWAMVGSGAVVTHDVPDHGLVYGNPARLRGLVCACGERLVPASGDQLLVGCSSSRAAEALVGGCRVVCPRCGSAVIVSQKVYDAAYGANCG